MSLTVVVNGPEGIVLAADTRVTVPYYNPRGGPASVSFDNATKVLSFGEDHAWVGAVTYGLASIRGRTAHSLMPEFEVQLDRDSDQDYTIAEYAAQLSAFFMERWNEAGYSDVDPPGGGMIFIVAGYDATKPYGEVWTFAIPTIPRPSQSNTFQAWWGGYANVATRILTGIDPRMGTALQERFGLTAEDRDALMRDLESQFKLSVNVARLPLQDCVDLAIFMIRTTITAQALAVMERGVGGVIEVATITPVEGFSWVQRKELHGERGV